MFQKVLIANRGAVAARVIRALHELRVASVAVFSEADRELPYLAHATEAHPIGPAPARESYLDQERLLALAKSRSVHSTALCPEHPMLDIALLAIGLAFFALSVGYVVACDRL